VRLELCHKNCKTTFEIHVKLLYKVKCSRYRPGVAQRVGRGIALLFHDGGTRREWVVSSTPLPHFTPGKDPVPILQETGWAPGSVWKGGNLVPTGIRSRTIQPVVSRYTYWATQPTYTYMYMCVCVCTYIYIPTKISFRSFSHETYDRTDRDKQTYTKGDRNWSLDPDTKCV